jgi:RNA polymerase sigma-54 factor
METRLKLQIGQQQVMTPQLLQSIRLLQLSSLELEQEVRQALETNVVLEEAEEEAEHEAPAFERPAEPVEATDNTEAAVTGCDAAAADKVEADYDWSSAESWSGGEPAGDDDEAPFASRTASPNGEDLRMRALSQLRLTVSDEREQRLVSALIEHIDDNGYLETPLATILETLPSDWLVSMEELELALRRVQSVEPTGFGARDLRECLLLQLDDLAEGTPGLALARRLVIEFLDRLAQVDPARLAAEAGCDMDSYGCAMRLIRALDPKPGSTVREPAQNVVPEVLVSGSGRTWKVELNPETLPRVRVNRLYEKMLAGTPHRALKDQLQQARWLVHGLEMRNETLLKTARAVFARQCEFLRRGEEGMAPLTLREIAQQIGMHESTVCRVVASKYALTPWGVYPLKAFFPSQIAGAEGETSGTAVRAMIRRIIDGENRAAPLCDGAIVALLARRGVKVARRTVAKYREAMNIAPATARARPLAVAV